MANPNAKRPVNGSSAALYIEQQVDDWIRAQIAGTPWTPKLPTKPSFIRRREVLNRVALSHGTIHALEKQGRFPRPCHIAGPEPRRRERVRLGDDE